ncbi:MAG: PfkB family carbohydrate kinase, partial [Candidatus Neomarinimicrobiota bacterium]
GRYTNDLNDRETLFTELGVFENFEPVLSDQNRRSEIVYLGNIQPSLQLAIRAETPDARRVISDTMNLWINQNGEELNEVLSKTDILLINEEEALQLTGQEDWSAATAELLESGPRTVVIKQGQGGSILAKGSSRRHIPIYHEARRVDPTRAGDSFAGGFSGHIASHGGADLEEAVIIGTATASYTVEDYGLEGLLKATPEGVEQRSAAIRRMMD